jgi:type I restriction enzyme S subunit
MKSIAAQSTRDYVGITAQKKLLWAVLPPSPEQERLASAAAAVHHKIREETSHTSKLRHLKLGLMHDLLTGRVRVPVRHHAEPNEAAANV